MLAASEAGWFRPETQSVRPRQLQHAAALNQPYRLGFVLQFATHLAFCQKEARVKLDEERFFLLGKFLERRQNKGFAAPCHHSP